MKKLIVLSVVFALVVPAVFAADLGVDVFGHINLFEGNSDETNGDYGKATLAAVDGLQTAAAMDRLRIEGSGGNDNFGGWYRLQGNSGGLAGIFGYAWWKPIDQFKLGIGGNGGDGLFGKEGYAGWMFNQQANEIGVAGGGDKVWGGGYQVAGTHFYRNAFYEGWAGDVALTLEIDPLDMVGIKLVLPFSGSTDGAGHPGDASFEEVLKGIHAQVNLNFDFGSFALTYRGEKRYYNHATYGDITKDAGVFYFYFNLSAIENLSLDFGAGIDFTEKTPIDIGLALKYDINDAFGIKFRTLLGFGGPDKAPFVLHADLQPYYQINDDLKFHFDMGLSMLSPDTGDATVGFHVNPYLAIGSEWGPTFYVGFQLFTNGQKGLNKAKIDEDVIFFEMPIGFIISF